MHNSGNFGSAGGSGFWTGASSNNVRGPPAPGGFNYNAGRQNIEDDDYQGGYNSRNNDYGRNSFGNGKLIKKSFFRKLKSIFPIGFNSRGGGGGKSINIENKQHM